MSEEPFTARYHWRRWWLAVALFGGGLVLVAGFVAWIDPYDKFHDRVHPPHELHTMEAPFYLVRMSKLSRAELGKAEVVVLGESRAYPLTEGQATSSVNGLPVVNMAFPGSSLEEEMTTLTEYAPHLAKVRVVLCLISPHWFFTPAREDRAKQLRPLLRWSPPYLLNREVLVAAVDRLRTPPKPAPPPLTGPIRMINWEAEFRDRVWKSVSGKSDPTEVEHRINRLRAALEPWRARGAKVLLWAPPIERDMFQRMERFGVRGEWEALKGRLQELAPVLDLMGEQEVRGRKVTFVDPLHHYLGPYLLEVLVYEARAR